MNKNELVKKIFNYELDLFHSYSNAKKIKMVVDGKELKSLKGRKKIKELFILYDIGNGEILEKKFIL